MFSLDHGLRVRVFFFGMAPLLYVSLTIIASQHLSSASKKCRSLPGNQSWLRESEQSVEWIFCLTAARVLVANQERR